MIRISVSDLETVRYYKANERASMAELVAKLKRAEPPTPQMRAGSALAKLFEHQSGEVLDLATVDGIRFDFGAMTGTMPLCRFREVKGEKLYDTPSGRVTLVGKVDGLDALRVRDQKLTENWDAANYLDSLQGRSYLDMFNAHEFVYDVFRRTKHDDDDPGLVKITAYHPLTFYRYPGMDEDVREAVFELARIVAFYIPDLVTADAATT